MKKSNVFLLVYGLFLLFVSFVKDYELVSQIALSATIASIFFSFSDLLLTSGGSIKRACFHLSRKIEETEKTLLFKKSKNVEQGRDSKLEEAENCINDAKKIIEQLIDRANKRIQFGCILFAVGIFSFLVVSSCYDKQNVFFLKLEKVSSNATVAAFAIIILNYWVQEWYADFIHQKLDLIGLQVDL